MLTPDAAAWYVTIGEGLSLSVFINQRLVNESNWTVFQVSQKLRVIGLSLFESVIMNDFAFPSLCMYLAVHSLERL